MIFNTNSYQIPVLLNVGSATHPYSTAKDSLVHRCKIQHEISSDDTNYINRPTQTLKISIISKGCGTGE